MLAYFDSFAGLVPVRIVAVGDWNDQSSDARFLVTASRGGYKRGTLHTFALRNLVPRKAVRVRNGQYKIGPYKWNAETV
jgi:hypothetical protein